MSRYVWYASVYRRCACARAFARQSCRPRRARAIARWRAACIAGSGMSVRRLIQILVPIIALGCKPPGEPPSREVELFRGELRLPERFPIRHGLDIDIVPVQQALDRLALIARADLGGRFAAELGALQRRRAPAAPEYGAVVDLGEAEMAPFAETMANEYVLDPNPERLALRAVLATLPTQMARSLGLSTGQAAAWAAFLRLAKPAAFDCSAETGQPAVRLDYGGVDVFVVTFATRGAAWIPRTVSWQQRGRVMTARN